MPRPIIEEADPDEVDEEELLQLSVAVEGREDRSVPGLTSQALHLHDTVTFAEKFFRENVRHELPEPEQKRRRTTPQPVQPPNQLTSATGEVAGEIASSGTPQPSFSERKDVSDWIKVLQKGWSKCSAVHDLGLDGNAEGLITKPPDVNGLDKSKWKAALEGFEKQFSDFQKLLLGESRMKDQEIKSLASTLKKQAAAKARKAGLKDNPTLMTDRVKGLAEAILQMKQFRSDMVSVRPKALDAESIKTSIAAMVTTWEKIGGLEKKISMVSTPELWVQSWVSHSLRT